MIWLDSFSCVRFFNNTNAQAWTSSLSIRNERTIDRAIHSKLILFSLYYYCCLCIIETISSMCLRTWTTPYSVSLFRINDDLTNKWMRRDIIIITLFSSSLNNTFFNIEFSENSKQAVVYEKGICWWGMTLGYYAIVVIVWQKRSSYIDWTKPTTTINWRRTYW